MKKLCLLLALGGAVNLANADIGSGLTDYYNSLQANSKIERPSYTTNGFTAGGYYQRGANVDLTMGYITPPSLKGGCGNIDFNMGAFSFINGDQIVNALKAIGQNAKALLFTEAIEITSASLAGNMKHWIDEMNKWLSVLKNSCQASSILMGGVNKSVGLCQNAARFNGSLSDENTVQSTCQTYDQGAKAWNDLFGSTTDEAKNAKAAAAAQIALQGGILQNILSDYFDKMGKSNQMQQDLGNLVLSIVGDVYIPPLDKNGDNGKGLGAPVSIYPPLKIDTLLSYTTSDITDQAANVQGSVFNCDFTWDKDNFRAKNDCFVVPKNYKTDNAKSVTAMQTLIYNKITKLHTSLLNDTGQITDADLTVLTISDAPIFQLMQAGVDSGLDSTVYPIVLKYMDYAIHKIYYNIVDTVYKETSTQITALSASADEAQIAALSGIKDQLKVVRSDIDAQLQKDQERNKLDPMELMQRLAMIRGVILKNVSPNLQEKLVYSGTTLRN